MRLHLCALTYVALGGVNHLTLLMQLYLCSFTRVASGVVVDVVFRRIACVTYVDSTGPIPEHV